MSLEVSRRAGGLEKADTLRALVGIVSRRAGGLEKEVAGVQGL